MFYNSYKPQQNIKDTGLEMTETPNRHFIYLNWRPSKSTQQTYHKDHRSSVSVDTSVGPYKNSFADFVMDKNSIYYWEVQIAVGSYFKVGVIKEDSIETLGKKAFSDIATGYAWFSTGKLRQGSNTTGTDFGTGFGPGDVVKVEFNSKEGTLRFAKNDDPLKVAFTVPDFKKGGYVPAVAAIIEGSQYSLTLPGLED